MSRLEDGKVKSFYEDIIRGFEKQRQDRTLRDGSTKRVCRHQCTQTLMPMGCGPRIILYWCILIYILVITNFKLGTMFLLHLKETPWRH